MVAVTINIEKKIYNYPGNVYVFMDQIRCILSTKFYRIINRVHFKQSLNIISFKTNWQRCFLFSVKGNVIHGWYRFRIVSSMANCNSDLNEEPVEWYRLYSIKMWKSFHFLY